MAPSGAFFRKQQLKDETKLHLYCDSTNIFSE